MKGLVASGRETAKAIPQAECTPMWNDWCRGSEQKPLIEICMCLVPALSWTVFLNGSVANIAGLLRWGLDFPTEGSFKGLYQSLELRECGTATWGVLCRSLFLVCNAVPWEF